MYAEITSVLFDRLLIRLPYLKSLLAGQLDLKAAVLVYDDCVSVIAEASLYKYRQISAKK